MTLFTVVMSDTTEIEVYGGLAACDAYLFAAIGPGAAAYRALAVGGDDRKRLLVAATRYIDSMDWIGEASGLDDTTLAWPREGEGTVLDDYTDAEQLALVEQAAFELVAIAAVNPGALTTLDASSNIKRAEVSGAEVEFFAPTSIDEGTATKLPIPVQRLLGRFLAGGGTAGVVVSVGGSSSYGCGSSFDRRDALKRRNPF